MHESESRQRPCAPKNVVTVMLYHLYKPVRRTGSLVTALFSFAALTIGVLSDLGVMRFPINTVVLFSAYCIGLGWLTLKATFLPRAIGVLLIVAGLGWLTYLHPPLAKRLGALARRKKSTAFECPAVGCYAGRRRSSCSTPTAARSQWFAWPASQCLSYRLPSLRLPRPRAMNLSGRMLCSI
jgi:hypothetical protein